MTTTAATTSASPSTSNDSPIQDIIASDNKESPSVSQLNHQQQQQQQPPPPPPQQQQSSRPPQQQQTNAEQKRPMNAFLLYCKRQRSVVREKYPNLENRGITKILGDLWLKLDKEQKSKYNELARQQKEAFMKANPDFKWCKTPMSSNNNNNSNSNSNSNESYASNNRHTESSPSAHTDVGITLTVVQSDSKSSSNRNHHNEAPKPPKKRFLERNDSIYTKNNSSTVNEPGPHAKDGVVPLLLDQDSIDRVIDDAFSKKSNGSPSGINMCKCSNRNPTNLTTSSSVNQNSFSSSTTTTTSSSSATTASTTTAMNTSFSSRVDEPVDFSMKRTINATRQQIINNTVEKLLSDPSDGNSSTSKINGTDSVQSQLGPPVKRENPEDT